MCAHVHMYSLCPMLSDCNILCMYLYIYILSGNSSIVLVYVCTHIYVYVFMSGASSIVKFYVCIYIYLVWDLFDSQPLCTHVYTFLSGNPSIVFLRMRIYIYPGAPSTVFFKCMRVFICIHLVRDPFDSKKQCVYMYMAWGPFDNQIVV